jgi:hypothetical protein
VRGKACKRLKTLFNPKEGDETSKKAYRLAKKQYKSFNEDEKESFIKNLEIIHNSKQ